MFSRLKMFLTALLCAACEAGLAQIGPGTVLEVQLENAVAYISDVSDASKFATDPNITTATLPRNLGTSLFIADIVSVNGRPARGISIHSVRTISLSTSPTAGVAIADTARNWLIDSALEILQTDGTPIGTIYASGLSGGAPPPGAPLAQEASNQAVLGGTGAFLGARGQLGGGPLAVPWRRASVTEDPMNRRTHGGGKLSQFVHLLPLARPEIVNTPTGPAVAHSNDFSPVTAARPARPGEILSLLATGLGPTRPGVDPGKPFPANPLAAVNSPVEVMVNGRPAEVIGAVGYPGATGSYQVNFRLPAEAERGLATIQLSAAWITGPEVRIAVQ